MGQKRPILVRQVRHRLTDRTLPRHFVGDDLLMSHLAAVFSSAFPESEAFFMRSVRHYRPAITDPELATARSGEARGWLLTASRYQP